MCQSWNISPTLVAAVRTVMMADQNHSGVGRRTIRLSRKISANSPASQGSPPRCPRCSSSPTKSPVLVPKTLAAQRQNQYLESMRGRERM
ncbi:MAG: hypothetical protein V7K15_10345 [Nostoc sp.]